MKKLLSASILLFNCLTGPTVATATHLENMYNTPESGAPITVNLYATSQDGTSGAKLGTVTLEISKYGLLITPALKKLPTGILGFHIHTTADCARFGDAAGAHLDPEQKNMHLGPYNDGGHLGDIPDLSVDENGHATLSILAPRITHLATVKHHALIIHDHMDNYTDTNKHGARIACGIIE